MAMNLDRFKKIRDLIIRVRHIYFVKIWGMDIDPTARFSLSAKLDKTYPSGIHIGAESYVAFGTSILTHDMVRGLYLDTKIGRRCFVGARSLILPGVTVGDGSIVAAGSVVTKDVPPGCIVAGNPAKVIRENIEVGLYGRLKEADENEKRCLAKSVMIEKI
ncbi:MAG: acyltransferase [Alphaproteobacteria bacterium]